MITIYVNSQAPDIAFPSVPNGHGERASERTGGAFIYSRLAFDSHAAARRRLSCKIARAPIKPATRRGLTSVSKRLRGRDVFYALRRISVFEALCRRARTAEKAFRLDVLCEIFRPSKSFEVWRK